MSVPLTLVTPAINDPESSFIVIYRAPVAVGVTLVSSRDLLEDGMRGKGVMIYHVYQDLLWFVSI